jgi:uncharacterized membrane protein YphA (DoxX/SURF4 family)
MSETSRRRWGHILLIAGRVVIGAIFILAAYAKLRPAIAGTPWSAASVRTSLNMFAMQVDSYQLLSTANAIAVAHFLPFFELFLGLWLVSGFWLRIPSLIATLLLCGFMAAMIRAYALGLGINCGCFGPGEQVGLKSFLRDGSFVALSLAVTIGAFFVARKKSAPESSSPSAAELQQAR